MKIDTEAKFQEVIRAVEHRIYLKLVEMLGEDDHDADGLAADVAGDFEFDDTFPDVEDIARFATSRVIRQLERMGHENRRSRTTDREGR